MNRQEQIEKMANDMVGEIDYDVNYYSDDNYSEVIIDYKTTAKNIVEKGYINGADFVEWLKSKYADLYYLDTFNRQDIFEIDQALQEYLKGE